MHKILLLSGATLVLGAGSVFAYLQAQPKDQLSNLALANIEAMAISETTTTYNCTGKGDCSGFTCGVCMTTVPPGKGNLTGGHKCW